MSNKPENQPWVPVVSKTGKPLMPCSPRRARKLLEKGKAIKRWYRDFFYIKLTEREDGEVQDVAIGIDPGPLPMLNLKYLRSYVLYTVNKGYVIP